MANKKKDRKLINQKRKVEREKARQKAEKQKKEQRQEQAKKTAETYFSKELLEEQERLEKIIKSYRERNPDYKFASEEKFINLEPQLQVDQFIRIYDFVIDSVDTYDPNLFKGLKIKGIDEETGELKGKGINWFFRNRDNISVIYNNLKEGLYPTDKLLADFYKAYHGLKYITQLTTINKEKREDYKKYVEAMNRLAEIKMNFDILRYKESNNPLNWSDKKYLSRMWAQIRDVISTMHYSSDQAIDFVLSYDYDIVHSDFTMDAVKKAVFADRFASFEKRAKESQQAYDDSLNLANLKQLKELQINNENQEKLKESELDITKLEANDFAKFYNIQGYSKRRIGDNQVIAYLQQQLKKFDEPKDIMFEFQKQLHNSGTIVQNNQPLSMSQILVLSEMLQKQIDEMEGE